MEGSHEDAYGKGTTRIVSYNQGSYEFLDKDGRPKDVDDLADAELIKEIYNTRAMNTIMTGLSSSESDKVS